MLHLISIVRRPDLASAPWELTVNGASMDLLERLPTEQQVKDAISRFDGLTKDVQD